jgi:hypothetical protein
MSTVIDYEQVVSQFESALLTQLRGHSSDVEFLEMWVPDADPVKSILNMVDCAEISGIDKIQVAVSEATLNDAAFETLKNSLDTDYSVRLENDGVRRLLSITKGSSS